MVGPRIADPADDGQLPVIPHLREAFEGRIEAQLIVKMQNFVWRIGQLRPDVVLMDLHMPIKSGVAATREITSAQPNTQVLVLTTLDDDETVLEAVRAGAQAYLLKDAGEEELLETIRALRRGESRSAPCPSSKLR